MIDDDLPGERPDDSDENETELNIAVIDDLRDENAAKLRELLGLPEPKQSTVDIEIEFVQMYLAYCVDFGVFDEVRTEEYNCTDALWDLNVLKEAIEKVEISIKEVMGKPRKRGRKKPKKETAIVGGVLEELSRMTVELKEREEDTKAESLVIGGKRREN